MPAFKVDENLPAEAAEFLETKGYSAPTVLSQRLGGEPDSRISAVCMSEGRAILTLDLDFADIRNYPPDEYAGIVVLRLARQDKATVLSVLNRLEPKFQSDELVGKLWIVDEHTIRIRG